MATPEPGNSAPHELDDASVAWLVGLSSPGAVREQAVADLHALLLRAGRAEANRRARRWCVSGPELDDVAHQAAADALVAVTAKLGQFEGRSRFTTWAQKFVLLEVASKLARHWWQGVDVHLDAEDWDRLPAVLGADPAHSVAWRGLVAAVHEGVDTVLTPHQREAFVAVVLDGVPLDAVCALSGSTRGAVYKTVFDARRKLRAHLDSQGLLDAPPAPVKAS